MDCNDNDDCEVADYVDPPQCKRCGGCLSDCDYECRCVCNDDVQATLTEATKASRVAFWVLVGFVLVVLATGAAGHYLATVL